MDVQNEILYTYDDIYAGQDPLLSMGGDWDHGLLSANNRIEAVRTKDYKYVRYYSKDRIMIPRIGMENSTIFGLMGVISIQTEIPSLVN